MVIGAGPAGSATALRLAHHGAGRILLADAGGFDGFRIGESIPPDTGLLLAELDLLPGFLVSGPGLALAFVSMSIGALTGLRREDAGVASGLINTTQQIGGAIGVATAITIATTATSHYVNAHAGVSAFAGAALTHGFTVAFWVLAVVAAVGAVVAAVTIQSQPSAPEAAPEAALAALETGSA